MNEKELREALWRRKLSAQEREACLVRPPDGETGLEEEMELSELLGRLPDAPVSSNFTVQVLQRVERDVL
ncbi:MAG: hypothetical protein ABJC04_02575, partial [Verrucomicrobiota bacterium]